MRSSYLALRCYAGENAVTHHAVSLSGLGKFVQLAASATVRRSSTRRPESCVAYPARQWLPPCPAAAQQPAASVQKHVASGSSRHSHHWI